MKLLNGNGLSPPPPTPSTHRRFGFNNESTSSFILFMKWEREDIIWLNKRTNTSFLSSSFSRHSSLHLSDYFSRFTLWVSSEGGEGNDQIESWEESWNEFIHKCRQSVTVHHSNYFFYFLSLSATLGTYFLSEVISSSSFPEEGVRLTGSFTVRDVVKTKRSLK